MVAGAGQFHFTIFLAKLLEKLYFYQGIYRKCMIWFMGETHQDQNYIARLMAVLGSITVMAILRHDQCLIPSVSLASNILYSQWQLAYCYYDRDD